MEGRRGTESDILGKEISAEEQTQALGASFRHYIFLITKISKVNLLLKNEGLGTGPKDAVQRGAPSVDSNRWVGLSWITACEEEGPPWKRRAHPGACQPQAPPQCGTPGRGPSY